MLVEERFVLNPIVRRSLKHRKEKFGFGLLGLATYYRTYSRIKSNGQQERWADTVIRAVEGAMSIRKDHYIKNGINWNEENWQIIATKMANAVFDRRMLPPGRGLWTGGTEYVYERGSMSLNNCAFRSVGMLSDSAAWIMNALMMGVGVGFDTHRHGFYMERPKEEVEVYDIPDSREGWCESVRRILASYEEGTATVHCRYHLIRREGEPIKGFGGTASGPGPLILLHERLHTFCQAFVDGRTSHTRLIADVVNAIATCVVAGNVRRSALIALGRPDDTEFLDLKNWRLPENRERMGPTGWGHTSNNSVVLESTEDFDYLPEIASRVSLNGEPGVINLLNIQKYGRLNDKMPDKAIGINPCGEIPLESNELCNLVEVFPTNCKTEDDFLEAIDLATIYASSISLLMTGSEETNAVIAENRRIGVALGGIADWMAAVPRKSDIVRLMNTGYELVKRRNINLAIEAKVPPSVRLTTVKPSGTISFLAGVSPGMHHAIFQTYVRRMRVGANNPILEPLVQAGVPVEPDVKDPSGTMILEFPIHNKGVRAQDQVSLAEHGLRLILISRFWADNAASNTSTFRGSLYDADGVASPYDPEHPKRNLVSKGEEDDIESWLTYVMPFVKSTSMLPYYNGSTTYPQMPYEAISYDEYEKRLAVIGDVDWSKFEGSDGEETRFCESDHCVI